MAARLLTESKAFSNMLDTMLLGCGCQRSSPWVTGNSPKTHFVQHNWVPWSQRVDLCLHTQLGEPAAFFWQGVLTPHLPPSLPGLKTGGGSSGGSGNTFHYTFHGDPHATFASFFGGSNPFDIFFASSRSRVFNGFDQEDMDIDDDDDPFSAFGRFGFNGINGVHRRHQESLHTRRKVQDPPVIHELKVSLEEIYHGSTKRMKITRRRLNADGRTMRTEDKILNIVIKRGWKEGTKITFPKEGDATPDNIPADIVFILKDKPHSHFKRDGTNVVYTANISLKEVGASGNALGERWHGVVARTGPGPRPVPKRTDQVGCERHEQSPLQRGDQLVLKFWSSASMLQVGHGYCSPD